MEIPVLSLFQKENPVILVPEQEPSEVTDSLAAAIDQIGDKNPQLKAALLKLNGSRIELLEKVNRFIRLRDMVSDQQEKEAVCKANAEKYRDETRELIRSGNNDQDQLHALAGKIETALVLASEHRAFAEELDLDREDAEIELIQEYKKYGADKSKAFELFVESEFTAFISEIQEPLQRVLKLKSIFFAPKYPVVLADDITPTQAALNYLYTYIKNNLGNFGSYNLEQDDKFQAIFSGLSVKIPIDNSKLNASPANISKRRANLNRQSYEEKNAAI